MRPARVSRRTPADRSRDSRAGFALIAVVLVLAALLLLCTPFLMTVRNADRGSARFAHRTDVRIAIDSAARRARGVLGASHPGVDPSPAFDSVAELEVDNGFEAGFLNANDARGVMWDMEVEDLAARIDLSSASPQVLANVAGGVTHLSRALASSDEELSVVSTAGFPPEGFVWVEGELIGYGSAKPSSFGPLVRGLGVAEGQEKLSPCAPLPASSHSLGAAVVDQTMWALARWRIMTPDGELRPYDTFERLEEAADFALLGVVGADALSTLRLRGSVHGGVRAGARWQRPVRLTARVNGGPEGCLVRVDDGRWFNPGTTIQVSDGVTSELALVRYAGTGGIYLMNPLVNDYEPFETEVRALARRPVNINTASPVVVMALIENLQLRGRAARITTAEARKLTELVVASRPFTGLEDFLRRIVLPAAGLEPLPKDAAVVPAIFADTAGDRAAAQRGGFIDQDDALALYKNALNANDNELAFSTMPFAFTSRDVYALELRASVNARSGIERALLIRENVELIVPQRELLSVWTRQSEFDEAPRHDRNANGWVTGPNNTARFDPAYGSGGGAWPTQARAHLGRFDTQPSVDPLAVEQDEPTHTYGSQEEDGWLQPRPARTDEEDERQGRVLHFDDEARDIEGRFLPAAPVRLDPADAVVDWVDGAGFLKPFTFSAWIRPYQLVDGARFLDVGGPYPDSDRVSLLIDGADLVLRVLDAGGDHPVTSEREVGEVRYEIAAGDGPGMPLDTWMHIGIDVRGNRPDQLTLLTDGQAVGRTMGMTHLTGGLSEGATTIAVESTEGFPDRCVLRIGEELIEAQKTGASSFQAHYQSQGSNAGYGGRLARERFLLTVYGDQVVQIPEDDQKQTNHAAGTTVMQYGYSLPIQERIPSAAGRLGGSLGPFAVARVVGVVRSGSVKTEAQMEPIQLQIAGEIDPIVRGYGMHESQRSGVTGLVLASADSGSSGAVMAAFSEAGGYAVILGPGFGDGFGGNLVTTSGAPLGGIEVIRYSGRSGDELRIERGPQMAAQLPNLAGSDIGVSAAFIVWWNTLIPGQEGWNERLELQTFVVPISVPAGADASPLGFLEATAGNSQFAQITRLGNEAHLTEWVRYDEIVGGHLLRDDPTVLHEVHTMVHFGTDSFTPFVPGGGHPVNPTGGQQPIGPSALAESTLIEPIATSEPIVPALSAAQGDSSWQSSIGTSEIDHLPLTNAVASIFRFRGVLGTYSHSHPQGTTVLPVCRAQQIDENGGWPGRFDAVMLLDGGPNQPGWPAVVQHAWRPHPTDENYLLNTWIPGGGSLTAEAGPPAINPEFGFAFDATYFALEEAALVPILPLAGVGASTVGSSVADPRRLARLTLFPSGELPRIASALALGGEYQGAGLVPEATLDEVAFTAANPLRTPGDQFVLSARLDAGGTSLELDPYLLRTPIGDLGVGQPVLTFLPQDAGLLQIGTEILCYDSIDPGSGMLQIPVGGRGLLGTQPRAHAPGEAASFLSEFRVSVLRSNLSAEGARVPLVDIDGFPQRGTVLIGRELVHYTHTFGLDLAMPRASAKAGARDGDGVGLYRGRYGTQPTSHAARAPVILFPFRYWDRWAERGDAPEQHYFGLAAHQPGAFWKTTFWQTEPAPSGPLLGLLQRTDDAIPWDADPATTPGLTLFGLASTEESAGVPATVPLGVQADQVEWRLFVRHEPGSFDPDFGRAHAWKGAPRLNLFGVEYFGPGRVLRSIDR